MYFKVILESGLGSRIQRCAIAHTIPDWANVGEYGFEFNNRDWSIKTGQGQNLNTSKRSTIFELSL